MEGFRFSKRMYDAINDGVPRRLVAGRDYPRGMSLEKIKRRLEQAAFKRDAQVSVWRADGDIYVIMCPWPKLKRVAGHPGEG